MTKRGLTRRVTRRVLLQTGAAAALGVLDPSRFIAHSLAATYSTSTKWFEVTRIDRTTVNLPFRATPARNMAREIPHWSWSEVIEVHLASGQIGFGETLLYYTWGAPDDEDLRQALGRNAIELLWDDDLGAGLQMALFDAVAKTAGTPVHALLGKKIHDLTPVAWWNIDTSVEDMVSECMEAHRQGYRGYKTKGRPWFDVWAQVEAVSKAVPPEFHLAIDFNDTLIDAERGIPILKDLEQYPQAAIWETPIFQSDIAGNQAIRGACRAPVAMHYGDPEPVVAIREQVCDGFVIGGGAKRVLTRGTVAAMADMPFWLQLVGTDITAAWSLQLGGVLSHATWPAVNCHQLFEHRLLTEPIRVVDGRAKVPDAPGLGFELNRSALARFLVEKPKSRPNPRRLIETRWPDGRVMYIANSDEVNFMLNAARAGKTPYFERGVDTKLLPDDNSPQWRELYELASQGPVMQAGN